LIINSEQLLFQIADSVRFVLGKAQPFDIDPILEKEDWNANDPIMALDSIANNNMFLTLV